ncbi:MAG: accessory gene regulator B family protein [Peptococcaceae bacterium]|nr:accessory gene regulator B family protein [Peptococcaceae bacterium]
MGRLAQWMVAQLVAQQTVPAEDAPIYVYGLAGILRTILHLGCALLLAVILGIVPETLCFYLVFIPLRLFAGGHHAKTPGGCLAISVMVFCNRFRKYHISLDCL